MGQYFKLGTLFGVLTFCTPFCCHAQSGWQWPSASKTAPATKPISWEDLPNGPPQGLIGSADQVFTGKSFAFPPQAPSSPRASTTALPWSSLGAPNVPHAAGQTTSKRPSKIAAQALARAAAPTPRPSVPAPQAAIPWAPTTKHAPVAASGTASPVDLPASQAGVIGPMDAAIVDHQAGLIGPIDDVVAQMPPALNQSTTDRRVAPLRQPLPPTRPQPQPMTTIAATSSSPPVDLLPLQAKPQPAKAVTESPAPLDFIGATSTKPQESLVPEEPGTYVLQNLQSAPHTATSEQASGSLVPIDILPFNRLITTQDTAELNGTYSVAAMIGPLSDASGLFSQLHITNDFRDQPSVPPNKIRQDRDSEGYGIDWPYHDYAWVTPTFYHRPLYFEQVNLERYGTGPKRRWQPFYSALHFFGSVGLVPYKLITQHPCEHVYTLGHRRPGDCVPYQRRTLLGQSYPGEALKYFHDYAGYR